MKNILLPTIEKALNAYLHSDIGSRKRLARLAGKSVAVELLPFDIIFICSFHPDSVSVHMDDGNANPAATIKGSPLQLFGMLLDKDHRQQFFADDVVMEGDAEVAQQVMHLFEHVHIDWEEHASTFIGDVPAHHLGKLAGNLRKWVKNTSSSFSQDANDYLHEEKAWFPHREELQDFFADIDTIRMDTDRLEARIARLYAQLNKEETK